MAADFVNPHLRRQHLSWPPRGGHSESTTDGDGGGHGDASVVNITVTPARGGTTGPSLISGGSDSPNKRLVSVIVNQILAGSPAELSELWPLDRVLTINGAPIGPSTSHTGAINLVKEAAVTGSVRLVVARTVIGELGQSPCRRLSSHTAQFWTPSALQLQHTPLEISLRKRNGKFGFTIRTVDDGNPHVALVVPGSSAARSNLQVGQMIVKINGTAVAGRDHDVCMKMLSSSSDNAILTVIPDWIHGKYLRRSSKLNSPIMNSEFINSAKPLGAKQRPNPEVCWCFDPIRLWEGYPRYRYLVLLVPAVLPWIWPVSVASDPAGDSCLDPGSDSYLDCCDEYGVALKPYWVNVVSAFIFAFLLGTTKTNRRLTEQINAELPAKRAAQAARRAAAKKRGRCCRWVCCVSRCPSWFDCWARCPTVTWFDCWVDYGTPTANLIADAKAKEKDAKQAKNAADDELWTRGCCGWCFWGCCGDDQRILIFSYDAAAAIENQVISSLDVKAALAEARKDRDRWVWFIVGIQLVFAYVSTMVLVGELRARGLQGWELYQAATLLSSNSTLGGFLAAALGVTLRVASADLAQAFNRAADLSFGAASDEVRDRQDTKDDIPAIFSAVSKCAALGAGGIGACASLTHIAPGLVLFMPYILAGFSAVLCFGLAVGWMLGMPRVMVGKNSAPEGTVLRSAGEALAQTVWILAATGSIVTAATVTVQYYAGVPWEQAIANDWETRTSANYIGCLARQLSGSVANTHAEAVAIIDVMGLVF